MSCSVTRWSSPLDASLLGDVGVVVFDERKSLLFFLVLAFFLLSLVCPSMDVRSCVSVEQKTDAKEDAQGRGSRLKYGGRKGRSTKFLLRR